MNTHDSTQDAYNTIRSDNDHLNPEKQRPGLLAIVRRLLNENPEWNVDRAAAKAKSLYRKGVRE